MEISNRIAGSCIDCKFTLMADSAAAVTERLGCDRCLERATVVKRSSVSVDLVWLANGA